MTAVFTHVQDGPACSGTGSVALTCAATQAGSQLFAVVLCPDPGPFTAPTADWRGPKTIAAGTAGHLEIWYLEGKHNPGGITSVTFAGPSGITCRGFVTEHSLPSGWSMILDAPGQAAGTGGTSMPVPSAAGCAADCLGILAAADFFATATTGTWTTPSGWTQLRAQTGTVQANWAVFASEDLSSGMHTPTTGFSTGGAAGWCAALAMFRPVQFTPCGISGGERLEVVAVDPTSQVIIGGGDVEGIWRSADFGDHWQPVLDGIYNSGWVHFSAVAWSVMPGEPAGTVYALTGDTGANGGFLVSEDGGRTWAMRSTGVQGMGNASGSPPRPANESSGADRWVGDLIAQAPSSGYLYCCDANTGWVKRSSDLGTSWTAIPFAGSGTFYARGVIVNPGNDKEVWACNWQTTTSGTSNGGVWHCPDATVSSPAWTQLTGYTGTVSDLAVVGTHLYAACNTGGVYRCPVTSTTLNSLNGSGAAGGAAGGSTSTTLVGATAISTGYPPASDKVGAAALFDSYLDPKGTQTRYPLAITKQNWYAATYLSTTGATDSDATTWPATATALNNNQGELGRLVAAYPNLVFQYSISPLRSAVTAGGATLTTQQNAVNAFCKLLKATWPGAAYEIALWHECNDNSKNLFSDSGGTGQPSYQAYWNAYAPSIKAAGCKVVYSCLMSNPTANAKLAIDMIPDGNANCLPDAIYTDWYAAGAFGAGAPGNVNWATYTGGFNPDTVIGGASICTKANAIKVPVGLAEFGASINAPILDASPVYGQPSTYPAWTAYINYMIALFTGAGGTAGTQPDAVADVCMYTGQNPPPAPNTITPPDASGNPTDYKITDLDRLYDTLSGSSTSTGSGGLATGSGQKYNSLAGYQDAAGNDVIIVGVGDGTKPSGGKHYTAIMRLSIPASWTPTGTAQITYTDLTNQAGGGINVSTLPPDGRPWWKAGGTFTNWLGGGAFEDPHIVIDPNDTQAIYIAATGGFWRTADGGLNWETAVNGMDMIQSIIMAADPASPGHIITGGDDYSTFDIPGVAGVSASVQPLSLGSGQESHAVCFGTDSTVYAGSNTKYGKNAGGGVYSHPPGNLTWSAELGFAKAGGGNACTGIYAGTDNTGTNFLLACAQGTGTFRATQNKTTGAWTWGTTMVGPMGSKVTGQVTPFCSQSLTSAFIYCFDRPTGIFRSSDYGQSWTNICNTVTASSQDSGWLALNPDASGELWISSTNSPHGLYKMTGAGTGVVGGAGGPVLTAITAGPSDPAGLGFWNGILYVLQISSSSTPSAQLWAYNGTTWTQVNPEIGSYLSDPRQMLVTSNGTALIESGYNAYIQGSLAPVSTQPLAVVTTSLPSGATGTAYTASLTASGGTAPYTWALTSGSLPAGLTLTAAGVISGTPTGSGTSSFAVQVSDSAGNIASSGTLSVTVNSTQQLAIQTTTLPQAAVSTAYSATLTAAGGTTPYTWTLASGSSLPALLSLSAGGVISGTPLAAGNPSFTVKVTDSASHTATQALALTVNPAPATLTVQTTSLPAGFTSVAYAAGLSAAGGVTPYTWALASGSLPAGLSLDTDGSATGTAGTISGTPAGTGTSSFTATVTDSVGSTATSGSLSITVTAAVLDITTTSLPAATEGSAYSQTLSAAYGTTPYTWAIPAPGTTGTLPAGLSLNTSTGVISGTPSVSGLFAFTAQVTDSARPTPATDTQPLTINIPAAVLTIETVSLPGATTGSAYSQTLTADGGIPPYTWALLDNTGTAGLPAGLSLNTTTGVISGTVTAAPGPVTFTIQVTDSATPTGSIDTQILTIAVNPAGTAPGAAVLLMLTPARTWAEPAPESLNAAGTGWQPDGEWALAGGAWGGGGAGGYPGSYEPTY